MKKILALALALVMIACAAIACAEIADLETALTFDRESHVTSWEGKWVLVAAYVGEDFADEYDVETTGLIEVEPVITIELSTILDATANDKTLGTMVDVASYIHGHTHDLAGVLTLNDEEYTIKSAWDEWPNNVIRGENDGDFNYGPAKTHVKGDDETLAWAEITGVEIEDMEDFKFIGVGKEGHLILCYSDDNVAKKDGEIGFAFIFERAE